MTKNKRRTRGKKLTVETYRSITSDPQFNLGLWRDKARCVELVDEPGNGFTTLDWFPLQGAGTKPSEKVIEVCAECPVRLDCLCYAIKTVQPEGIWAGYRVKRIKIMGRKIKRRIDV